MPANVEYFLCDRYPLAVWLLEGDTTLEDNGLLCVCVCVYAVTAYNYVIDTQTLDIHTRGVVLK